MPAARAAPTAVWSKLLFSSLRDFFQRRESGGCKQIMHGHKAGRGGSSTYRGCMMQPSAMFQGTNGSATAVDILMFPWVSDHYLSQHGPFFSSNPRSSARSISYLACTCAFSCVRQGGHWRQDAASGISAVLGWAYHYGGRPWRIGTALGVPISAAVVRGRPKGESVRVTTAFGNSSK